ncbi:MAG: aminotransferase class IV [Desulfovermiculus sp.]
MVITWDLLHRSPHVLPGIMQARALKALADLGFTHVHRPVFPQELFTADAVLPTNSLLGVIGAGYLDGQKLYRRDDLSHMLNHLIFCFQPIP